MDAEKLDSINNTFNKYFLRFKKEAGLSLNQYLVLIRLHAE